MLLPKLNFYLFIIVFSQFAGTSLWFVGNAILPELSNELNSSLNLAFIISVVQIGFIAGTLVFSFLSIADNYKSTAVFFICSAIAALFNVAIIWVKDVSVLYMLRFFTGFFLAGIYPVGMKIAADIFQDKLGNALGFLVGALVIGTAFPHFLKAQTAELSYQWVIGATSLLSIVGGAFMYLLVPSKRPLSAPHISYKNISYLFRSKKFLSASLGYFGHMWELYAFWAFVPVALFFHNDLNQTLLSIPLWSFIIIASGAIGCIGGGLLSKKRGSAFVAKVSLFISACCCLLSPLFIAAGTAPFLIFMVTWSVFVIADSPQFSALVAQAAPPESKGTALTFVTSVGFAITIISIQVLEVATADFSRFGFLILAVGPALALIWLLKAK